MFLTTIMLWHCVVLACCLRWAVALGCRCLSFTEGKDDTFNTEIAGLGRNETNLSYGIGCGPHDLAGPFTACTSTDPEKWCGDAWCYVAEGCTLASKSSSYRVGRSYSYSQCGYLDRFTSEYVEKETFQGQTINVVVMTNSGGWKGSYCDRDEGCSGPTWSLVNDLIQRTGSVSNVSTTFYGGPLANYPGAYPPQVMDQVSRDQQSSAFTACAYATGMGFVDICIGAFTATPARDLLSLNLHLWAEPVYLIAPKAESESGFLQNITKAFSPLTAPVWLCIGAFLFAGSLLVMFQERYGPGVSLGDGQFGHPSLASAAWEATYVGFNGLFAASHSFEAKTVGGRMTTLAMGFLILLTVSAYTANLATALIVEQTASAKVASMEAILRNGWKICTQDNSYLVSHFNFPESQTVLIDGRREVLNAIGQQCEAGVMALEDFESGHMDSSLCHLLRVGDPLYYEQQMCPVSERFKRAATFHLREARVQGSWTNALKVHQPADVCLQAAEDAEAARQQTGLELQDMAGPLIVAVTFCFLGIVADTLQYLWLRRIPVDVVGQVVPEGDGPDGLEVVTSDEGIRKSAEAPGTETLEADVTEERTEVLDEIKQIEDILQRLKRRSQRSDMCDVPIQHV